MEFKTQSATYETSVLEEIIAKPPTSFALICRTQPDGRKIVETIIGNASIINSLNDVDPMPLDSNDEETMLDTLVLLPYRLISERGFDAVDDGTPLVAIKIDRHEQVSVEDVIDKIPSLSVETVNSGFDIDDQQYMSLVQAILDDEISRGSGASFVIRRSYSAEIQDYSISRALSIFKKLLSQEKGAYWTFIVCTGERTLIGATPERHVSFDNGIATMNPISGTYIYPPAGANLNGLKSFLNDEKEVAELYIVADEELKMMCSACDDDVWLDGPHLKEMTRVAHTEYLIHGKPSKGPIELLRHTMFAPTVMGGPIESAARVIYRYEPEGRGYYSGVVALIGRKNGQRTLDSGIVIRTADINMQGYLKISVGASLVRDSNPTAEANETRGKVSGMLSALGISTAPNFHSHPDVLQLLGNRNNSVSDFWLHQKSGLSKKDSELPDLRILIVDAEDLFTSMIKHQLQSLGCSIDVKRFDEYYAYENYDLVVMGPGPGDPRDLENAKISHLYGAIKQLIKTKKPFMAVCLSHQILASVLELNLTQRPTPNQGIQKRISLFGNDECVGFYNSFSARCDCDQVSVPGTNEVVELARDNSTGEVHAMRSTHFYSIQFHAESLLTIDGVAIFKRMLEHLLPSDNPLDVAFNKDLRHARHIESELMEFEQ